jgi:hypothetical protein
LEQFTSRWEIAPTVLGGWAAEHRSPDGRHIRYIVGRSAHELVGMLATAELVEP